MNLLVPTDFSDIAERAFDAALHYARTVGASVHILHVHAPFEVDVPRLLAELKARAADVTVTVSSAGGDPAAEILRYAATHPVDLIVMGTHGRTGWSRMILGSVTEQVIRAGRCPVLVVPPGIPEAAPATTPADRDELEALPERPCLVCATPGRDLVCTSCRARIRGEALLRKQGDERAARVGGDRR